jgi:hypothetical protein
MNIHGIYAAVGRGSRGRRMRRMWQALGLTSASRVLDVGGTDGIWSLLPEQPRVVLLNLGAPPREARDGRRQYVVADACRLPFTDNAFDALFSNSLIEHLFTFERQAMFASECGRVARRYFVQCPNQRFTLEPHLLTPFVHWLPPRARLRLLRNFTVWGWLTRPSRAQCQQFLQEVRMLTAGEMRALFPDAIVWKERRFGLAKSLVAVKGAAGVRPSGNGPGGDSRCQGHA